MVIFLRCPLCHLSTLMISRNRIFTHCHGLEKWKEQKFDNITYYLYTHIHASPRGRKACSLCNVHGLLKFTLLLAVDIHTSVSVHTFTQVQHMAFSNHVVQKKKNKHSHGEFQALVIPINHTVHKIEK
jgi:hypothetical protein